MAQRLRDDKIGALTGGASISMAASSASPAWLTIGGQQYRITSALTVSTTLTSANTRYQVYAVISGGSPALVISSNENSVGPAGYTSWKLVASYYTNGMSPVAFGSFINIEGVPETGEITWVCSPTISGGTSPTKGTTSVDRAVYIRRGKTLFARHEYNQSSAGTAGSGGDGIYRWNLPGITLDSTNMTVSGGNGRQANNTCFLYNGVVLGAFGTIQPGPDGVSFVYVAVNTAQRQGSGYYAINQADSLQGCSFEFPVSGWSNTPIKDL